MKTGISLQDLARKLEENRDAKKDFITDTREARVVFDGGKFAIDMQGQGAFPLQSHPLRQIGEHTGVPAKYMERMRAEAPELLVTNVNAWFDRKPERRMVRTLRSEGRAFLSNRYQRIENDRIAEVALPCPRWTTGSAASTAWWANRCSSAPTSGARSRIPTGWTGPTTPVGPTTRR